MKEITIKTSKEYKVHIGAGILEMLGVLLKSGLQQQGRQLGKVCLVSDERVYSIYGEKVMESLKKKTGEAHLSKMAGSDAISFIISPGEESKSMANYQRLLEFLASNHFDRDDLIIALGGGVVGDLAGFAAATYKRGIDYVQIPTTILAAVDSSIGGKTAINLAEGKNLVGAFHQPLMVICDVLTFETLEERQRRNGMAEVVKYSIICGKQAAQDMEEIVASCVEIKKSIVEQDEMDTGKRQVLNLGHTIGHAIETASDYQVLHGEGVSMGIATVARYMVQSGKLPEAEYQIIMEWLTNQGLPVEISLPKEKIWEAIALDKKRKGNAITMVLPYQIGDCRLVEIPMEIVKEIL